MPADGSGEPRAVAGSEANVRFAQLSPDGRFLAYAADESGRLEVYVASFPEPGGRWQVSRDGGTEPRWRGDGKELFYAAADNTLTAVEVVTQGASLSFGRAERLFQARDHANWRYAASRDGRRFLVSVPIEEQLTSPIMIRTGWTALLGKR